MALQNGRKSYVTYSQNFTERKSNMTEWLRKVKRLRSQEAERAYDLLKELGFKEGDIFTQEELEAKIDLVHCRDAPSDLCLAHYLNAIISTDCLEVSYKFKGLEKHEQ